MQLYLVIQKREVEISLKATCIHLVETAPSILRKMPWVVLKNHTVREKNLVGGGGGMVSSSAGFYGF